jgi:hypothetical protein
MLDNWRMWLAGSFSALVGTAVASVAPSTVVMWGGTVTTLVLGAIGLYQRARQTKRMEDLADAQAFAETWKQKYGEATEEAAYWKKKTEEAERSGAQWERLYQASQQK